MAVSMKAIMRLATAGALGLAITLLSGCVIGKFFGAVAQSDEYQKKIEVPAQYAGLEHKTVAVLVDADMSTLHEHPTLVSQIAGGVSGRIQMHVPGVRVLPPQAVINWQWRVPQWNALPYGELAEQLNVDRVIHIDILEYRLNPPGNRWLWEGVCLGRIGIAERDGLDPDMFVNTFDLSAKFPSVSGVGRESANSRQIETGLLAQFIEKTAWLFYQHQEPKYPDKYRPELDRS
jgi:hypothetical protein